MASMLSATPPETPSGGLDRLDRIACLYLILPSFLFCLWFIPLVGSPLLALTGFASWQVLRGRTIGPSFPSPRWIIGIFVFALLWVAIAGVGHFFYTNADWIIRDAVLHDLSIAGWPPTYLHDGGSQLLLRAPVGYFLPSAAVGFLLSPSASNIAIYLWTVLGWGLFLLAACRLFSSKRERVICLFVLTMFGGMDLLGHAWAYREIAGLGQHIEWWMPSIQYSSNTTLLFWVPNHALPAWLGITLILRHWQQASLAKITPLLATAIPLWSPLAAIGLFPFFLFGLAWRRDFRTLFSPGSCLPFAPIALLTMKYLGMDASEVPHGWMSDMWGTWDLFAYRYVLFCLLEFGFLALILARFTQYTTPMRIAVVVLCLLPFYYLGIGNDLAMRASIPALCVLALAAVKPLAQTPRNLWHGMLAGVLLIGALGAASEPARAFLEPAWQPLGKTIPASVRREHPEAISLYPPHYFAREDSPLLRRLMRHPQVLDTSKEKPY